MELIPHGNKHDVSVASGVAHRSLQHTEVLAGDAEIVVLLDLGQDFKKVLVIRTLPKGYRLWNTNSEIFFFFLEELQWGLDNHL